MNILIPVPPADWYPLTSEKERDPSSVNRLPTVIDALETETEKTSLSSSKNTFMFVPFKLTSSSIADPVLLILIII